LSEMIVKQRLIDLLNDVITKNEVDGVILSGGIDSSLLAAIASGKRKLVGITSIFRDFEGRDRFYSILVAKKLGMDHIVKEFSIDDAIFAAREVVRIMKTFDHIAIRNDIPVFLALKHCSEMGIDRVMTGDGGDELFAGYEYMLRMEPSQLSQYIDSLGKRWTFSSPLLGQSVGVKVVQPYLDPRVVKFARELSHQWRVRKSEFLYGKWILRSILEDLGLPEVAYRRKEPIEEGSGSILISKLLMESLGEEVKEIEAEAREEGVVFWSKEQAYFYRLFKEIFGRVPRSHGSEKSCSRCGAPLDLKRIACCYCGYCY